MDTLDDEIKRLEAVFKANGYPTRFIQHHSKIRNQNIVCQTVSKCPAYIRLPFRGDDITRTFETRLKCAVNRTYYAARAVIVYDCNRLPIATVKDRVNQYDQSNLINQFKCGCGHTYIGRTERRLRTRVGEHVPVWVQRQLSQSHDGVTNTCNHSNAD